jgi:hypothetical protein
MTRPTSSKDPNATPLDRRSFLRGATTLGVGLAALPALSAPVAAVGSSSYQIMAGTKYETTAHVYDSGRDGPTTMVVGGLHGDEKSGYLAADQIAQWGVEYGKLVVIPRSNVVAIAADSRYVDGIDLNRAFPPLGGDCTHPLAEALWAEVVKHDPDWMFDLHSSRGIYQSGDGGVGQAMFPTWTTPARYRGEKAVAALNDYFGLSGDMAYLMGNTLDADRDMLMHRVAGMLDRPGYLCETTEKADLDDQVQWHLFSVEHVMNQIGQPRGTAATTSTPTVEFDARTVSIDEFWRTISFENRYSHPTVVAPSLSYVGDDPAHVRLKGATGTSIEARVEEWAYLNDRHYEEEAGLLVFNRGTHSSDNGRHIEARRNRVDHQWRRISFDRTFSSTPVVLATSQTLVGDDPIIVRFQNVTRSSFEMRVQEEDAEHEGEYHYEELVGWIAFEPGRGSLNGRDYEAGTVSADHRWQHLEFGRSYSNPVFLANPTTYEGWNTVTVRYKNLTSTGVDFFLQEDQSADEEMTHDTKETVSYVVVEG